MSETTNAERGVMDEEPRPIRNSSFILHPSSFRGAFSLLELMIAIVILGIGLVMVATIFPIGIDMAAQTVQSTIAQAATDAAMITLQLKVPPRADINGDGAQSGALVLAPDVLATDADTNLTSEDSLAMALNGRSAPPWSVPYKSMGVSNLGDLFPGPPQLPRLRFFTEGTGWTGEQGASGPGAAWDYAYVMPSQNLPPAYLNPPPPYAPIDSVQRLPAMIPPTLGRTPDLYPLNLVDCVYPPVSLTRLDGTVRPFIPDATDPVGVIGDLAQRRYSWIAIHRATNPSLGGARFIVTILVTHRSNLASRYARQADPVPGDSAYEPIFDPNPTNNTLDQPAPDADTADRLFPQPWLVRFALINPGLGEVRCTPAVGRLLPPGSFFVLARSIYDYDDPSGNPVTPPRLVLAAGTAYEVLSRREAGGYSTLQIRRQNEADEWLSRIPTPDPNRPLEVPYAWVVPPAIVRSGNTWSFGAKSPIAGVAMRMMN